MADEAVLKEFLVRLGFDVNQSSARTFLSSIESMTLKVAGLGLAVEAAAVAVVAGVNRMAESMENLYFMSLRTGATVGGIQAIGFAASQLGSSVSAARGSLESFGMFLKTNPGGMALLSALGVNTNQPTEGIMASFGQQMSKMPLYLAQRYAAMMGIDYRTLLALENPDLQRQQQFATDTFRRLGVDEEAAAKAGHEFEMQWRSLGITFQAVYNKIELLLAPAMGDDIKKFRETIEQNFDFISTSVSKAATGLITIAQDLTELFISFSKTVVQIHGVAVALVGPEGVKGALEQIAIFLAVGFLPPWLSAIIRITMVVNDLKRALEGASYSLEYFLFGKERADATARLRALSIAAAARGSDPTHEEIERAMHGDTETSPPAGADVQTRARSLMDFLTKQAGFTPQGAGVLTSELQAESGIQNIPTTLAPYTDRSAWGLGQWTGSRRVQMDQKAREWGMDRSGDAFNRRFLLWDIQNNFPALWQQLHDPNQSVGDLNKSVWRAWAGANPPPDLLRTEGAHYANSNEYTQMAGGGSNATLTQTNHITVNGAGDPQATASAIQESLQRTYADAVRIQQGAIR